MSLRTWKAVDTFCVALWLLCGGPSLAFAQNTCFSSDIETVSSNAQNCRGGDPHDLATTFRTDSLSTTITCNTNPYSGDGPSSTFDWQATGMCGYTPNGTPPVCPGIIDGPTVDLGCNGATNSYRQLLWDALWDDNTNGCQYDNHYEYDSVGCESCTGDTCSGPLAVAACSDTFGLGFCSSTRSCGNDANASCSSSGECCSGWCSTEAQVCGPPPSPILINFANNGAEDHLTSAEAGVEFDIDADGGLNQIAWTERGSSVAFLARDLNGNGEIDNGAELFGTATLLPNGARAGNGFEALAALDTNHDGKISSSDVDFGKLRLWFDFNHDGHVSVGEMKTLTEMDVVSIDTAYREFNKRDEFGNAYRYRGSAQMASGKQVNQRKVFDVFFAVAF